MCWHRWSGWETIETGKYVHYTEYGESTVWFDVQHRFCFHCDRTQLRTATTSLLGDVDSKIQKAPDASQS